MTLWCYPGRVNKLFPTVRDDVLKFAYFIVVREYCSSGWCSIIEEIVTRVVNETNFLVVMCVNKVAVVKNKWINCRKMAKIMRRWWSGNVNHGLIFFVRLCRLTFGGSSDSGAYVWLESSPLFGIGKMWK